VTTKTHSIDDSRNGPCNQTDNLGNNPGVPTLPLRLHRDVPHRVRHADQRQALRLLVLVQRELQVRDVTVVHSTGAGRALGDARAADAPPARERQLQARVDARVVALQVEFERQFLKPVFHLIDYRLLV
jgi:hypothetical protein